MEVAENYLGQITHVIDPDNFSMQVGTDESLAEFIQFEMRLEDFGQNCTRPMDLYTLKIGDIVLVDCMETEKGWRRGQVANVKSVTKSLLSHQSIYRSQVSLHEDHPAEVDCEESVVDVVYIDYGSSEHVDKSRLCIDFPEEFLQYPAMALKCQLSGIRPIARSWTTKAVKMFSELTHGIVFHTFFLPPSHMFKSMVALYFQQGTENSIWAGRSLAHVLMDQELGIVSENEMTEFLENAPEFCREKIRQAAYAESSENNQEIFGYEDGSDAHVSASDYLARMSNGEESEEEGGFSTDNFTDFQYSRPSGATDGNSPSDIYEPSSEEVISESGSSPDGSLNPSQSTEAHNSGNKVVISGFDFDRIHHTKDICTDRLSERIAEQARQQLEQENEKIMEDVKECKSLAVEAGYGEVDHREESLPPRFRSAARTELPPPLVPETMGTRDPPPGSVRPSTSQSLMEDRLPSKRYSLTRREARPGVEERMELGPFRGRGRGKQDKSCSVRPSSSSPVIGLSGPRPTSGSPVIGSHSCITPKVAYENYTLDTPPASNNLEQFANSASPEKREEMVHTLQKIFSDTGKDSDEETRVRLQSLFFTDLYMYLDKEQLKEVIYLLLNRAVRYYGDIHDVLLDIIQILSVTEDFMDCLYESCKKIEENYIKVQYMGSPFHLQASKVLSHLFTMSLHWTASNKIQELVLSALEKWIIFNKTAHQTGQDKIQEVYLECFNTVWCIVGNDICKMYPEQKSRLQRECRNKILNDNVSRLVRSKLLDIYIEKFVISSTTSKEDGSTQTEIPLCVSQGVQTDMVKITGRQSQLESQSPVPKETSDKGKHSKMRTPNTKSKAYRNETQRDKEWPKLSSPKVPDWTNSLLDSPKVSDWNNLEGNSSSLLHTPDSPNSSMYFSTEEKSFHSSPDMKRKSPFLNSPDNLRTRSLHQLRNPRESPTVSSEPMQTFTNWSDNIVFGSRSNFLSKENLPENPENERKSKLLQSKVFQYVSKNPDTAGAQRTHQHPPSSQQHSSKAKNMAKTNGELYSKKAGSFKEAARSKSGGSESCWDMGGGSNVQSSVGSEEDSSGSEKRPKGRGRGRGSKKELSEPQRPTTPIQRADGMERKSQDRVNYLKRENPLRQRSENPLRNENVNNNCGDVSGASGGKSTKKEMDWFEMKEVDIRTSSEMVKPSSEQEDNVPDDWYEASDEEKSAKDSQNSDVQAPPSEGSDVIANKRKAAKSQVLNKGDSSSLSSKEDEKSAKFNGEFGSGDGQLRNADFSDDGVDDGSWTTDSSDDDIRLQVEDSNPQVSENSGVSKWVPGQRKCTLCGSHDHLIYKCPRKRDNNFFL